MRRWAVVSADAASDGFDRSARRSAAVHCVVCGDRIGVYEPAVWVIGSTPHATSRAADPELTATHDTAFHAGCYPVT
jgi:hypothetical protein